MPPKFTFELNILFHTEKRHLSETKEKVKAWLFAHGEESFVEGDIDDLDIDHEFVDPTRDFYNENGGSSTPIKLYSYDVEYLQDISARLLEAFSGHIDCRHSKMETIVWLEGWKASFKPIKTEKFYLYPPWEKKINDSKLIPMIIDPGMAFGTGQHATTQICLQALETLRIDNNAKDHLRCLDVGTGSGVLSIAANKLGFNTVHACDIDANAMVASKQNARANDVEIRVWKGSLPSTNHLALKDSGPYDLVLANILFVVLDKIMNELTLEMKDHGKLILSGILSEQKQQMLQRARECGLKLLDEWEQSAWVGLLLEKK